MMPLGIHWLNALLGGIFLSLFLEWWLAAVTVDGGTINFWSNSLFGLFGFITTCTVVRLVKLRVATKSTFSDPKKIRHGLQLLLQEVEREQASSLIRQRRAEGKLISGSESVDEELTMIVDLIVRDYVKDFFYSFISDDPEFLDEVSRDLREVFSALSGYTTGVSIFLALDYIVRIHVLDLVNFCMGPAVDVFLSHLAYYRKAFGRASVSMTSAPEMTPDKKRALFEKELIDNFFDLERLHRFLVDGSPEVEQMYLRQVSELLLFTSTPGPIFRDTAARYMLREVLSGTVLSGVVNALCNPDFFNTTLNYYLPSEAKNFPSFLRYIKICNDPSELEYILHKIRKGMDKITRQLDALKQKGRDGVNKRESTGRAVRQYNIQVPHGSGLGVVALYNLDTMTLSRTQANKQTPARPDAEKPSQEQVQTPGQSQPQGLSVVHVSRTELKQRLNQLKQAEKHCLRREQALVSGLAANERPQTPASSYRETAETPASITQPADARGQPRLPVDTLAHLHAQTEQRITRTQSEAREPPRRPTQGHVESTYEIYGQRQHSEPRLSAQRRDGEARTMRSPAETRPLVGRSNTAADEQSRNQPREIENVGVRSDGRSEARMEHESVMKIPPVCTCKPSKRKRISATFRRSKGFRISDKASDIGTSSSKKGAKWSSSFNDLSTHRQYDESSPKTRENASHKNKKISKRAHEFSISLSDMAYSANTSADEGDSHVRHFGDDHLSVPFESGSNSEEGGLGKIEQGHVLGDIKIKQDHVVGDEDGIKEGRMRHGLRIGKVRADKMAQCEVHGRGVELRASSMSAMDQDMASVRFNSMVSSSLDIPTTTEDEVVFSPKEMNVLDTHMRGTASYEIPLQAYKSDDKMPDAAEAAHATGSELHGSGQGPQPANPAHGIEVQGRLYLLIDCLLWDASFYALMDFVQVDERALAGLSFWQVTETYRRLFADSSVSHEEKKLEAAEIAIYLENPLMPCDSKSVNAIQRILSSNSRVDEDLFTKVQQQVYDYLNKRWFAEFCRSEAFREDMPVRTTLDMPTSEVTHPQQAHEIGKRANAEPVNSDLCLPTYSADESSANCPGKPVDEVPTSSSDVNKSDLPISAEFRASVKERMERETALQQPGRVIWNAQIKEINVRSNKTQRSGEVVAYYVVVVTRTDTFGDISWLIDRRYSDFHDIDMLLHKTESNLPTFPPKKTLGNLRPKFLQQRKRALNSYMQELLAKHYITQNEKTERILSVFLSEGLYTHEYSNVAKKLDTVRDFFSLGHSSANINEDTFIPNPSRGTRNSYLESESYEDDQVRDEVFTILLACVEEIFDFKATSHGLVRKRFHLVVRFMVESYFSTLINTQMSETVNWIFGESQITTYLRSFRESFWPSNKLAPPGPTRDAEQRVNSKYDARARIMMNIPADMKRIVGGHNCRAGALRLFDMMQHEVMNKRLFYAMLEALLDHLFPDMNVRDLLKGILMRCNEEK
ncbi:hypothetical protein SARC_05498 [Sphaeroforma arctica JP610]|uniref:PX domain-containing protein n=1 Tax=Sphaeroforma arctica JP610 TaxID=667725 RepID=A0A0L0FZF4_9EUKA|nr:hypothetical protein SARC_05498 [Sphaeroforma arctica JP610]KNC82200.1 hypothetical protein SARC_05498 [Sphaeroforma arctica JP610]|eukprot:XP_014156102.1 hypothetical protein SARC_05498 [Sphaeroforma arctica JP610]